LPSLPISPHLSPFLPLSSLLLPSPSLLHLFPSLTPVASPCFKDHIPHQNASQHRRCRTIGRGNRAIPARSNARNTARSDAIAAFRAIIQRRHAVSITAFHRERRARTRMVVERELDGTNGVSP
jgi:hypothetical protein